MKIFSGSLDDRVTLLVDQDGIALTVLDADNNTKTLVRGFSDKNLDDLEGVQKTLNALYNKGALLRLLFELIANATISANLPKPQEESTDQLPLDLFSEEPDSPEVVSEEDTDIAD